MDHIEEFVDERHKGWCVHCGGGIDAAASNRDHVPSKSFLSEPPPPNLPHISTCKVCNEGFSLDEEYFVAFLGCVLSGSTDPDRQSDLRVQRILTRSPALRARIEQSRSEAPGPDGHRLVWTPERDRIDRVVLKNARGHAYFEYGEPMLEPPTHIWSAAIETMNPEDWNRFDTVDMGNGWPEVGSRMLTRVVTGQDLVEGWVVVEDGRYRYSVVQSGGILVRSVIAEYLATEVFWE